MSTKIYYAAKWKGTTQELFEYFDSVREKYFKHACDKYRPVLSSLSGRRDTARKELLSLINECTRDNLNIYGNIKASLVVFFYSGEYYLMYFGCEFLGEDYSSDKAVDFAYENSSDHQLTYLTEEEWCERGRIWDEILGADAPNKRGLVCELYTDITALDITWTLLEEWINGD